MASFAHSESNAISHWYIVPFCFTQPCHILGGDSDNSATRHGISGIECKVHNYLLDLSSVSSHTTCLLAQDDREGDILAENPTEHLLRLLEKLPQVDDLGLDHLLPAEGQELLREGSRPLGGILYDIQVAEDGLSVIRVALHHRAEPKDHLQHVVEVMRHPAGQSTEALEFLRLQHLRFQSVPLLLSLFPLADVP